MAKFFVAMTAVLMMAGCSCNKDAATTDTPAMAEAPATGDAATMDAAATPIDAATAPTETTAETMGTDPMATATPAK